MLIKYKKNLIREVFYFLTAVIILLVTAEIAWPNSVLAYLNMNYVIVLWVFSWLLLL